MVVTNMFYLHIGAMKNQIVSVVVINTTLLRILDNLRIENFIMYFSLRIR